MFDNRITHHPGGRFNACGSVRPRGHVFARRAATLVAMLVGVLLLTCVVGVASAQAATYYIAPDGNDGAAGTSTATAWRTFARAWQTLRAGDTLLLLDGTYNQSIAPTVNGTSGAPITVKALNDGKATIDGQGTLKPLNLGDGTGGGNYFVIDGLVMRNGPEHVALVKGSNNVLRRVSVYDANKDVNSQPLLLWGNNNLVEDCLVAGTGRGMVDLYSSSGNTVRRCFVKWSGWDGKNFCGVTWPNSFMIGVYNSSNSTIENSIAYGRGVTGILVQANNSEVTAANNQVLGSISMLMGKNYDGSIWHYGSPTWPVVTRPGPTDNPYGPENCDGHVTSWTWPGQRVGFQLFGQGTLSNNVFRDNLAANNAALGFSYNNPSGGLGGGNTVDHMTLYGNGVDAADSDGGQGNQAVFPPGVTCTNCRIGSATTGDGSGARLGNRYVNRQFTGDPLLPWPMESRAVSELGVSINAIVTSAIEQGGGVVAPIATPTPAAPPASPTPSTAPPSPTPAATSTPVPTSTPAPTELRMALAAAPQVIQRGGTVTIKVAMSSGVAGKPVRITVTDSAATDMQIAPAETTINAPGEAIFKATDRSGKQGDLHVLKFTAQAAGMDTVEQSVTILVDPVPLFLPAIMAGK